jgi:hypothetical protein
MQAGATLIAGGIACAMLVAHLVSAQQRSPDADWPTYNRDLAGT